MDSLEEADLYRSAIEKLIADTQDIGILDLIYKILIQTKNWKKNKFPLYFMLTRGYSMRSAEKKRWMRQFSKVSKLSKHPRFDLQKGVFFRLYIKLRRGKPGSNPCHGAAVRRRRIKLPFTDLCECLLCVFFERVLKLSQTLKKTGKQQKWIVIHLTRVLPPPTGRCG